MSPHKKLDSNLLKIYTASDLKLSGIPSAGRFLKQRPSIGAVRAAEVDLVRDIINLDKDLQANVLNVDKFGDSGIDKKVIETPAQIAGCIHIVRSQTV